MIGCIENEKRLIDYKTLLSAYEYKRFETITAKELLAIEALIINEVTLEKGLFKINYAREINQQLPIIWIIGIEDYGKIHEYICKVKGIGRIETIAYSGDKLNRLQEKIESVLHPNLPTKRNEIAFVIPVYNEEERIEHVKSFVRKIKHLNDQVIHNLSIYFINDGSSDRSKELIEELIHEMSNNESTVMMKEQFHIHDIKINTKKAGTYIESFKVISEDTIIFADADDGYDFEDVMRMLNLLNQGYYDIIVGTKDLLSENRPTVRRVVSAFKRVLTKPLLPKGVTDSQTGLKVFKTALLPYLLPSLDISYGLAIDLKILHVAKKHQFRVYEMPVRFIDREGSHVEVVKDSIKFVKSIMDMLLINGNKKVSKEEMTK